MGIVIFGLQIELRHQLGVLEMIAGTSGSGRFYIRIILGKKPIRNPTAVGKEVLSPSVSDKNHAVKP